MVHPKLDDVTRLGTTSVPKARGEILDRDRRPLMRERRVVRVGAIAGKVKKPAVTARGLAAVLDVDARPLERAIRGGGKEQFVDALVLRPADYRRLRSQIEGVPDAATAEGTAMLAPSREFARALLGTVAPATEEQLEKLGGRVGPGASVGQWGLQARFESRLAPVPERRVVIRAGAVPIETLATRAGRPGRALATTIDRRVQSAAEEALAGESDEAALVAVQPSTGDVLAVANRPVGSSYNRALEGTYAPGSTFKVVSTAALLRDGLSVGETVDCPATIEAGGRRFKNFEGGAEGAVPFSRDFAVSCNTAFVSLAPRLAPDALRRTARDYGLGRELDLSLPAASGRVPPGDDEVERAAAMIGQHEIVASPLAMALVAATVAEGRWRAPRLLAGDPATGRARAGGLGARYVARPDAPGRDGGLRHRPLRRRGRRQGEERHRRVRGRRSAAHPCVVHRLPGRRRRGRAGGARPLRRLGGGAARRPVLHGARSMSAPAIDERWPGGSSPASSRSGPTCPSRRSSTTGGTTGPSASARR